MNINDLPISDEAKDGIRGMVEYCLNNGIALGMDEGRDANDVPHKWVKEIEDFINTDYE